MISPDVIAAYNQLARLSNDEYVLLCNPAVAEELKSENLDLNICQDPRVPLETTYLMKKKDLMDGYLQERKLLEEENL